MCEKVLRSPLAAALALVLLLPGASARGQTAPRDPLLVPVPRPARVLGSWQEAASVLRARSTDLVIVTADVAEAEAASRRALAALVGQLQVQASYTVNLIAHESAQVSGVTITNPPEPTFETLSLPQRQFFTGTATGTLPLIAPRAWVGMTRASLGEDVAHAKLDDERRVLREGMANAIVGVVVAERSAQLSRESLAAAIDRGDLVTRKKTLGGGTILDVVRSQQDLEAARVQVLRSNESLHEAREALGLALGLREEVGVSADIRLDNAITEQLRSCQHIESLDQRADLVAAAQNVDVAHQTVRDAHAQLSPTVSLQTMLTTTTQDLGPYPQTQWYVQGLLSWNLWDGGQRSADLRTGHAQEEAAAAQLEQARRKASVDVTRALRMVEVSRQALEATQRETTFSAQQEKLTRAAYEVGQGTSLELVAAASAHRTQDIELALREYDLVHAQLAALFVQAKCRL
jgi:outer membrane protein TolC